MFNYQFAPTPAILLAILTTEEGIDGCRRRRRLLELVRLYPIKQTILHTIRFGTDDPNENEENPIDQLVIALIALCLNYQINDN